METEAEAQCRVEEEGEVASPRSEESVELSGVQ